MVETIKKYKWLMFILIALGALVTFWEWRHFERDTRYDLLILTAARQYDIDPALIKAVVWQESRFQARAHGGKGELGLMQIGKLAAQEWAEAERVESFRQDQLLDPRINTLVGSWYLSKMMRRYAHTDSPVHYALADYNAGRTHVLRWAQGAASTNSVLFLQHMDYPGTRKYILNIVKRHQVYQDDFPPRNLESP